MYVISGAVAGVGGGLNAISDPGRRPRQPVSFTLSAEALVMLVLGGTGSLYGALIGTVVFMLFEDFVSAANPFHWLTIVGALLVAVVLFAPKGLYGTAAACRWTQWRRADERGLRGRATEARPSAASRSTHDVSLAMAPGDRVALIGPNGAGKTTFVNLVTGTSEAGFRGRPLGGEDVTA